MFVKFSLHANLVTKGRVSCQKNPVVHFEMPYEDASRVSDFYSKAFGWNMIGLGEEMGNYVVAHTTETDDQQMATKAGHINGGFAQKTEIYTKPNIVISVDDIHVAMKDVQSAGGKVQGEPMDIPGIGIFVNFIDSEGNQVAMLQPSMPD